MTLADERRAIAQGMAASRAATGADERRAIGQRLVNERRGIKEDLNALEKSPRKNAQLPQLERRGTRPAAVGVGSWNPNRVPSSGGGGGLVSPITEVSRTYHAARVVWSADGLIPLLLRRTNVLIMRDAEGVEEERRFADAP